MADAIPGVLATDARLGPLSRLALDAHQVDLTPLLVYLVDIVDASALASLAEQFSLIGDGWSLAATEGAQRALIKGAVELHRFKGTPWAVKQVFVWLGLGEVTIEEGRGGRRRDGTQKRDGFVLRGDRTVGWAEYRVHCSRLLSVEQAEAARALLASVAPARCHLYEIDFSNAALIRSGAARRDGMYSRGSA